MNNKILSSISRQSKHFFSIPANRSLTVLAVLLVIALLDFYLVPQKRFLFSFYSVKNHRINVETRYFIPGKTKEDRVQHYAEEYLLGPSVIESLPLFPVDAQVETIMIRNNYAYINLSEAAALPIPGEVPFQKRSKLFVDMIRRNFPSIQGISLFIAGNELDHVNTYQKIIKSVDK